jgi:hypothetical protein
MIKQKLGVIGLAAVALVPGILGNMINVSAVDAASLTITNPGGTVNANSGVINPTFLVTAPAGDRISDVTVNVSSLQLVANNFSSGLSPFELYLRSPTGLALRLTLAESTEGSFFTNTTFSDAGVLLSSGASPYTGTFKPEGTIGNISANITSFAGFNNNLPGGTWGLTVFNTDPTNNATLGTVTLNIQTTPVPFEFSPLGGLVLLGGIFAVKRQFKKA